MTEILNEERFKIISDEDKAFLIAFDSAMNQLGYHYGNQIGSGYCWGKYMIIYRRIGVKNKKVYARIYIRDNSISLRLYFSKIQKHEKFIANAPNHINRVFVDDNGKCNHCNNEKDGKCKFRKTYSIDGHIIEKCNGETFVFNAPSLDKLNDYIELFSEFYPSRKRKVTE